MRPKTLPSSLRKPQRYLVFEIISDNEIEFVDARDTIREAILEFLGELYASKSRFWIIENLYSKNKGIIRCDPRYIEHIRVSLSLITYIGETQCLIRVIGVTGTIKSAKEKYLKEITLKNFGE